MYDSFHIYRKVEVNGVKVEIERMGRENGNKLAEIVVGERRLQIGE